MLLRHEAANFFRVVSLNLSCEHIRKYLNIRWAAVAVKGPYIYSIYKKN